MNYSAVKCPCGHPVCKSWLVDPVAAVQGVHFTEAQAKFVAAVMNLAEIAGDEIFSTEWMMNAVKTLAERKRGSPWRPIETAPHSAGLAESRYVLVRGPPPGYVGTKHFVVLACYDDQYRHDRWRLPDNTALSDFGWTPTEWMEVPE